MKGTTAHEFGHALGLLHEQSYPNGIKWNKDTVYKYYAKYQGWDKSTVDFNVLGASDIFYTNGTTYDPVSIMHYPVLAWQTVDGYTVGLNNDLSAGDKKIIAALYPKDRKVSTLAVPKIEITNIGYGEVKTDNVKKGILIYPSFDIKTSAVLGSVYFVARLTTEDGLYFIPTINENYSWNKMAATYIKMKLLPSSKASFNKTGEKNLELFFPFKEMPDLKGKKVKIQFSVYQDDVVNNRYQKLTFNFLSNPLTVPN
jgi:Astacin (Peptidase family M12A)